MYKTQNPLLIVPFKYGIIGSLMIIIGLLVLYYLGRHPLLLNPLLDARIPLYALIIFISFKVFKDQFNGGIMHFWQGLTMGLISYLVMACVAALFIYIFSEIGDTHFLAEFIRIKSEQLIANKEAYVEAYGVGEKAYNYAIEGLPLTQGSDLALHYIRQSIPIGLFLTIILSVLLRRKESTNQK
jgi:hypothetical protein